MSTAQRSRILIVTDQTETARALSRSLQQEEAFEVSIARNFATGLTMAQTEWPALIVSDLQKRPEMFDLCRTLKADRGTRPIPIIMLAKAHQAADRIAGLEAGADDYVGKPCNPREVLLRVKAVLRRGHRAVSEEQFVRGPICLDAARCQVAIDNRPIHLTAVEFKLLRILVRQPGEIQSRHALLSEARGHGEPPLETRTIDTHIRRLRRKLGKAADLIETVRGFGYRLRPA